MMPRICLLLAPVALLLMGCELVGAGGGDRYTEDVQAKYALRAGGRLAVETFNGSVDISVWDKDEVEVLGKKSCESKQDLARMEMKADQAGNSLVLRVLRPERLRNCGVSMTIRVPRRTEIDQISTSNGAVRLADTQGFTQIRTSNGSVNLRRHLGGVQLRTSNGNVELDHVQGAIAVESSNGSVKGTVAKLAEGRGVKVETSNGSIDVAFADYAGQTMELITSNGSLTLHLPEKANAEVRASTSNGSVRSEFGPATARNRWEGKLGTGGALLRLETSNGEIRLQKL
ncbi:MAG: DUF4097 family beta strand repeat-containing protein [Acidobacteriota bacterium]|jgi:hypothetical protein